MTNAALRVLYSDNHLIALIKPPGLLTQTNHTHNSSLIKETRQLIKEKYNKPGKVFLGMIHRLDRNVSGIVLFARTSKAASRLSTQFRKRTPKKYYKAIVLGKPKEKHAKLVHYLRKEKSLKATVFPRETPNTKYSELLYSVIESFEKKSILEISLLTGRFHQIRAQMAFIGHPILGDKKYGAPNALANKEIALHAYKLVFEHPISLKKIVLTSAEPKNWPQLKI